jgi:hypothetical protein
LLDEPRGTPVAMHGGIDADLAPHRAAITHLGY